MLLQNEKEKCGSEKKEESKHTVPAANKGEKSTVEQKKATQPLSTVTHEKKRIEAAPGNKKCSPIIVFDKSSTQMSNKQPQTPKTNTQKTAKAIDQVMQIRKHLSTISNTLRK